MPNFRVRWEIDIDADNATEAAARALIIQRDNDPANSANVFEVAETFQGDLGLMIGSFETVDLSE
ncbi:hypothetical protein [Sphingomonas jaspsi]|uniref:hypothetical protein n=1 Tax=Sphingomonas jaspsi TaxID=392409 RepID=UPI0004B6C288|nr:hypothetical protein [Sphingomonas jaspsi]